MPDLKDLALDHFQPQVDSDFRCSAEDADLSLRLTEAEPIQTAQKLTEGQRKPFSLTFRGAKDQPLEQGIYELNHDEIGSQELFLVPVAEDDENRYYEAVFT